jgi:two-component system cell cycle sensor histidine kinase PleC
MPIPGEQPDLVALPPESSPVKRRLAAQYVREARDRLTSSGGTRVAFDYELLRQYAQNRDLRLAGNPALVATVGFISEHMDRCAYCWHLDGRRTGHPRRHDRKVPAIPRTADERNFGARVAATIRYARFVLRTGLMFMLIHPVGVDESSSTFMLFVMLLVVAVSSMLASSLPTAVFAATFPVTTAVALDFILQGRLRDYILAIMALTAQGYFAALTYRLYSST